MSTSASLHTDDELTRGRFVRALAGVGAIAGAILMIELALTRIFSVTMYYHFAFLAISIALFGLSASGVYVYVMRRAFDTRSTASLLTLHSLLFAAATVLALAALVRIRVGLNYSHENLVKMIAIYTLAALPFFSGGAVISLAITRLRKQVNVVYGADLIGAAVGLPAAAAAAESLRRAGRRAAGGRARRRRRAALLACQGDGAHGGRSPRWRSAFPAACS